jgi:phosphate transport system substrate-binding protein
MHMNSFKIAVAGIVCMLATGVADAQEIRIGGGGAALATIFAPMKEQFEKSSGDRLTLIQNLPVKGLIALEKGELDAMTTTVPLATIMAEAAKEGVTVEPASLQQQEIGKNEVVAFVHKSNRIKKLSKSQLKKIFTGKVTNWKEFGGANLPIIVVWGTETPGQNALFTKEILDGEQVTAKAIKTSDYQNIREMVKANPGSIAIDPRGMAMATVGRVDIPIVTAPIILITKGKPSAKVEKVLQFYNEEFGYFSR